MSDIQKEIKEALEEAQKDGPHYVLSFRVQKNAISWLLHQQELIEQLQQKLDEGVGLVAEGMVLVESMGKVIEQRDAEIARLRQALTSERDEAMKWDGTGTVSRINKVLKGAST